MLPSLPSPMFLSLTDIDSFDLRSVVEHVFLPPKLPQEAQGDEAESRTNVALCHILVDEADNGVLCLFVATH